MMLRSRGGSSSLRISSGSSELIAATMTVRSALLALIACKADRMNAFHQAAVILPPLIEKREHCRGKSAGVVIRKLLPESEQLDAAIVRIALALIVVVLVDDGNQIVGNGLFQHPIEPRQYSQIKIVSAVHIFERGQIDPHVMEAGFTDHFEIALFERRIDAAVPNAVITENIDAACHLPRSGCGPVLGRTGRDRRQNTRQDDNRP